MRKLIWAVALVALLAGCKPFFEDPFYEEIPYYDTILMNLQWVKYNIRYVSDQTTWGGEEWQTPQQTYELRTGDCEDLVILTMYMCRWGGLGFPDLVAVRVNGSGHALMGLGGINYEVQTAYQALYDYEVWFTWTYEYVMAQAMYYRGL